VKILSLQRFIDSLLKDKYAGSYVNSYRQKIKDFRQDMKLSIKAQSLCTFALSGDDESCYVLAKTLDKFFDNYISGVSKIHLISNTFGSHLYRTNLDVPLKLLDINSNEVFFIEFPETVSVSDPQSDQKLVSCFLLSGVNEFGDKIIDFHFMGDDLSFFRFYLSFPIGSEDKKMSDVIDDNFFKEIERDRDHISKFDRSNAYIAVNFAVKCLLYILSGEPNLQNERGYAIGKGRKRNAKSRCPFDIVRVGYNFHKKIYRVGEAQVSGHFRWQPYGPNMSKVKLIWIDEHIRHYNNGLPSQPSQPNQSSQPSAMASS